MEKVPDFVFKQIRLTSPTVNETCLDSIETELTSTLLEFQREGILFGIARGGRFLLGDDMGLGKTRQALAVADFYKDDWPLLILTTASMRGFWQEQIISLLPNVPVQSIRIVESRNEPITDAKIVICSYAGMENNMKKFELIGFGMVIFDESHSLKNNKAKQTINATKLGQKANRVVLITGTPALSRPAELFSQLVIIDKRFCSYFQFTKRYCEGKDGPFGWIATGSSHLDELNILLRKKYMIRRTKDDVYAELGGKKREVVELKDLKLTQSDNEEMQELRSGYKQAEGKKKDQQKILVQWYSETAKFKASGVW